MTGPLLARAGKAYSQYRDHFAHSASQGWSCCSAHGPADLVPALVSTIRQLLDQQREPAPNPTTSPGSIPDPEPDEAPQPLDLAKITEDYQGYVHAMSGYSVHAVVDAVPELLGEVRRLRDQVRRLGVDASGGEGR